jgi:hypothetical protein
MRTLLRGLVTAVVAVVGFAGLATAAVVVTPQPLSLGETASGVTVAPVSDGITIVIADSGTLTFSADFLTGSGDYAFSYAGEFALNAPLVLAGLAPGSYTVSFAATGNGIVGITAVLTPIPAAAALLAPALLGLGYVGMRRRRDTA